MTPLLRCCQVQKTSTKRELREGLDAPAPAPPRRGSTSQLRTQIAPLRSPARPPENLRLTAKRVSHVPFRAQSCWQRTPARRLLCHCVRQIHQALPNPARPTLPMHRLMAGHAWHQRRLMGASAPPWPRPRDRHLAGSLVWQQPKPQHVLHVAPKTGHLLWEGQLDQQPAETMQKRPALPRATAHQDTNKCTPASSGRICHSPS
mmetsp:Transcript_40228/g.87754  ORF Transcript_40228/g.87754 Transcript_40228/m.87754 type:complete len:204 (-) Transcript_40228:1128-1739(-)